MTTYTSLVDGREVSGLLIDAMVGVVGRDKALEICEFCCEMEREIEHLHAHKTPKNEHDADVVHTKHP
jgi:hypothetical protein